MSSWLPEVWGRQGRNRGREGSVGGVSLIPTQLQGCSLEPSEEARTGQDMTGGESRPQGRQALFLSNGQAPFWPLPPVLLCVQILCSLWPPAWFSAPLVCGGPSPAPAYSPRCPLLPTLHSAMWCQPVSSVLSPATWTLLVQSPPLPGLPSPAHPVAPDPRNNPKLSCAPFLPCSLVVQTVISPVTLFCELYVDSSLPTVLGSF